MLLRHNPVDDGMMARYSQKSFSQISIARLFFFDSAMTMTLSASLRTTSCWHYQTP